MEKQDRQCMINHAYDELVKEIRRDLKEEILDHIEQRINQMEKLLENGVPFWLNTYGESSHRIHHTRQRIYTKIIILRNLCSSIHERY